ncbi:MAG: hypothetical protein IKX03_05075 [Bacteroidales bacterium]|nr:hypothetical protein [Bacteroidales bacterium]MBR5056549.1 hypothetical protein [Bacteroidales bacterium]
MKYNYDYPKVEVTLLSAEGLICDSGAGTEDFGKGTGIGDDMFDSMKPSDLFNFNF